MQEDNNHIDYFQLIPKYLSGNAGDSEVKLLEEWVLSSPENRERFNAFRRAWIFSGVQSENTHIDVEKEWQATAGQLFPEKKIVPLTARPRRRMALWAGVAAVVAVLVLATVWIVPSLKKDRYLEVVTRDKVEENRLPDGTQISLNQFASVRYLRGNDTAARRVALTGDAFFDVERDTARPFVISTQNVEIEVLGTAFYVDAREDQPRIEVIVQSGSVAVTAGGEQIVLSPNETGIYDRSAATLRKEQNENENYLAWKTSVLVFENATLEQVVFDLNRTFHANISIANQEITACQINATYDHQPLEAIVRIIEQTLNIDAEIRGEEVVFSGLSCE